MGHGPDGGRERFIEEITAVMNTVLKDATVMDLPSVIAAEAVAITAFDESETRPTQELIDALIEALRTAGWSVDARRRTEDEPSLYAAKLDVGGGSFAVQPPAISFSGVVDDAARG
ncbi:hypothetical protein N4G70_09775 [Streptomyces sp. ASQP_92]|uniref:hypothetical protein n=1 Tax=Streptomyces sp. ASQP_92 TaxID=2979116 RepID=UPI0021BF74B7|nr:hypothetical protein [Streptomyces sp. ASQP_92]MCT9089157.1 hypothetical protein [Streptomyces sp. ASQP_92]